MEKAGVESFMTEGGVVKVSEKMAAENPRRRNNQDTFVSLDRYQVGSFILAVRAVQE